jgi:predicted Rossmann fold flavoprotein
MTYDLAVIGGGPAGLMAAGIAAKRGLKVLLLERMNRTGRKLRITGKGRCNLTNITPLPEFIQHFGKNGKFLMQAFNQFFTQDLIDFFNKLGVETIVERGNRVFPASGSAVEVTDALIKWAVKCGVEIRNESRVTELVLQDERIVGLKYHIEKYKDIKQITRNVTPEIESTTISVKAVILATGGVSYPLTGSTGDGYILANEVGHPIIEPRPALVPLLTNENISKSLEGLTLRNVRATLFVNCKKAAFEFGEMEFRDHTICGPIILSLSGKAVKTMAEAISYQLSANSLFISIDLKPALELEQLDARILREIGKTSKSPFLNVMKELLPSQMIPICSELAELDVNKPSNQVTTEERKRLCIWLKDFKLPITGYRDWNEAIITAGGVDLKTIDPHTMASKLIPNFYVAGEILDLDADTGGYNLQAAFSTGWVAGTHVQ